MKPVGACLLTAMLVLLSSCDSSRRDADSFEESLEQYRQVRFDRAKPLGDFLLSVKQHYNIPALAAASITLDGIQSEGAVGQKNARLREKVTLNDIFCIGSCAKSMTATLVASMVEDGLARWDMRPLDVFPELKGVVHKGFRDMTIAQLLSHTAGVEPFVSDDAYFGVHETIDGLQGTVREQRRTFAIWNLRRRPATTPGSYSYSNGGYVIAAAMTEKLAGAPWETLIKKRVFEPLGLQSAFIGMPQDENAANARRHYHRDSDGKPVPLAMDARPMASLFNPAGTVSISITDFAKYALFHLRGLNGIDGALKSKAIENLHRPVARIDDGHGYALGWNVIRTGGLLISTHSGGDSSVYAVIGIDRRTKTAAVVVCNMGDAQATAACANVMLEITP